MESTSTTAINTTKRVLTITAGETYLGYCLAEYMLRESERNGRDRHGECRIRVLCSREKDCNRLRDMGAELIETDYEDHETLRRAFRDCEHVIFVPNMTKERVRHGNNIIEAMEREDVRHVLMMSWIGAETDSKEFKYLREIRELEKELELKFKRGKWCLFRMDLFQQMFFLWVPMIENDRRIRLNTGREGRFAPVNLNDVCRAAYVTVTGHKDNDRNRNRIHDMGVPQAMTSITSAVTRIAGDKNGNFRWMPFDERHHKKAYRLTGPEAVNGEMVARMLNKALDLKHELKFEPVSREEMRKEMEGMRDEDGKRRKNEVTGVDIQGAQMAERKDGDKRRDDGRNEKGHRHGKMRKPIGRCLTENDIETVLDFFEYVKMRNTDYTSDDLRNITGEDPESLGEFFRRHRDEFMGRGDDKSRQMQ